MHSDLIASWATLRASTISSSDTSFDSPSTIQIFSYEAPTIRLSVELSICSGVGLTTYLPSDLTTLTSDIGPLNGISETVKAADAAKAASASGKTSLSALIRFSITWVSAW